MINHGHMASAQDVFGQLWKEYALSDSRYMTADTLVLCMETMTVVCSPARVNERLPAIRLIRSWILTEFSTASLGAIMFLGRVLDLYSKFATSPTAVDRLHESPLR